MEYAGVTEVLGGVDILQGQIRNRLDFIELSNRGIPKGSLVRLSKYLNISIAQIAQLLHMTERTIKKYSPDKHFNQTVSEQILQIAEVAARGTEVFEDKEHFLSWMNRPNVAFSDLPPMNFMGSRFGVDIILEELGRIEHGVYS